MPYVHIRTTAEMKDAVKSALLEEIAPLLPILPGKNRGNAMIDLEGGCFMAMGDPSTPCAFCEIRLYKQSPADAKAKFAAELTALLENRLGIPSDHVYLNYIEMDHWGLRGGLI
ncbi:MAG: tautomerase family protein [Clostridia bacterium]|nr:tautomerase family protein [Clostridia bacterium]